MNLTSRRTFLKQTGTQAAVASLLGTSALKLSANPLGLPIGCQTWPVKEMIGKDFPGTIKQLADVGFQSIELCSPVGYKEFGFSSLAKYKGPELKKILADNGLNCVSAADEYNKMAERAAQAGIQQGLHNEEFELATVNGERTYDILLRLLDPKLVKFQFQVSTISRGYDAAEYFTKYPGRFFSMHVQGWSAQEKKIVAVGHDSLDWKKIFTTAKTAGVTTYYVEMNLELMKASVPYLRQLQV